MSLFLILIIMLNIHSFVVKFLSGLAYAYLYFITNEDSLLLYKDLNFEMCSYNLEFGFFDSDFLDEFLDKELLDLNSETILTMDSGSSSLFQDLMIKYTRTNLYNGYSVILNKLEAQHLWILENKSFQSKPSIYDTCIFPGDIQLNNHEIDLLHSIVRKSGIEHHYVFTEITLDNERVIEKGLAKYSRLELNLKPVSSSKTLIELVRKTLD